MTDFTIGIPVRNGEKYLKECIESALHQTRRADEILIVNDNSSDSSEQIIEQYLGTNNIRYIFNDKPTGFADAFNRLISYAKGEYFVLLACDDLLESTHLELVEKALNIYPNARHIFTGYEYINENGKRLGRSPPPYSESPLFLTGRDYIKKYIEGIFLNKHIHRCCGFATRRDLLQEVQFRTEAGLTADDDLFFRLGRVTDVLGLTQALVKIRMHADSVTSKNKNLELELANNYVFHIKSLRDATNHIEDNERNILQRLCVKFISKVFFDALLAKNLELVQSADRLRRSFEMYSNTNLLDRTKLWERMLWYFHEIFGVTAARTSARAMKQLLKLRGIRK